MKNKSKVAITKCEIYDEKIIEQKVRETIDLMQFDCTVFRNEKVIIKPNLLTSALPESGIVTHPFVFKSIIKIVKEHKGKPILVESPAILKLERTLQKTGYASIIKEEKIEVASNSDVIKIKYDAANKYKTFEVNAFLEQSTIIINLPKFKTHGITYVTGATKNVYGLIPGLRKAKLHLKGKSREEFVDLLLDYNVVLRNAFKKEKQFLHIMDAVICLEGEGPGSSGQPRLVGALMGSTDPVAIDATACRLVGLNEQKATFLKKAEELNLGNSDVDKITILGMKLDSFDIKNYKSPADKFQWTLINRILDSKLIRNFIVEKPVPQSKKCTLCYECKKICPAKAITRHKENTKVPVFNYAICIRCYCCSEICREGAITVKRSIL